MFMQIFFPLRLFALQGRHLSKVCSLGKSSEYCSLNFPIGKSLCLPFPWRKSGTNFCYCLRQFVITRQAACLRQEETLPQGPISGNFSPMIIGLNGSIFTPGNLLHKGCAMLPFVWEHFELIKAFTKTSSAMIAAAWCSFTSRRKS